MKATLVNEEWRPVVGYIGLYEASNFGRLRSLDHWTKNGRGDCLKKCKILKPCKNKNGYLQVSLYKDKKIKRLYVHRLVYEAFNGSIPDGIQVNHIDENPLNNRLENLNLMTCKENINYGTAIQRSTEKHSDPVLQLTLDDKLVKEWPSMSEAGRNGFRISCISLCCQGKLKSHKGFKWRKKY